MKRIAFIGCSKRKKSSPCIAEKLYQGELFKKSLQYCQQEKFDEIYILSAKYGVLSLDEMVSPYEKTLNTFSKSERIEWSDMVKAQLIERKIVGEYYFFCGNNYHEYFVGNKPLLKLSLGFQLQWFSSRLNNKPKGFNL